MVEWALNKTWQAIIKEENGYEIDMQMFYGFILISIDQQDLE